MDEGAIEYENGEREVGDPSLVWEIRDGQVKNPNAKIIIFGSDREALLYYGSILVPNVLEAEWKRIFNVAVTVEI
jgi:ABC-type amino acid transport substrate-binding protein